MEKKIANGIFTVKQLTTIGLLSAICIFMGITGLGFIPLPFMKATIMQIPVIIGAILEGPIVGATIGLVFGLSALCGTLTNTIGVLGLTYILFAGKYAQLTNVAANKVLGILGTIVLTNGIPESIISVVIVIPVVTGLQKILKRN